MESSTILMSQTLDSVYLRSVSAIAHMQTSYPGQENLMVFISQIGDPRYAFTFYFPVLYALDWVVGQRLLLVAVFAEWLNQVLKWALHGDRPYWWVRETLHYSNSSVPMPPMQQFDVTCETGPGCPSGHAMAMSAIWFIMVSAFIEKVVRPSKLVSSSKGALQQMLWWSYATFIIAIIVSRVYLATHFPHQCLLGAVIGCYLAYVLNRLSLDHYKLTHYLLATLFVTLTALGTYSILVALGSDPLWSVARALKWCDKPENVHLDTSPFFSMMRYCGAVFGLGLGVTSSMNARAKGVRYSNGMRIAAVILSLLSSRLMDVIGAALPKSNINVFYVYAFCLNALLPFLVTAVVPFLVVTTMGKKAKTPKKMK